MKGSLALQPIYRYGRMARSTAVLCLLILSSLVSLNGNGGAHPVQLHALSKPEPTVSAALASTPAVVSSRLDVNAVRVVGPETNQWVQVSNGSICLPPFEFANEASGSDGSRGAIYFSGAGDVGPNPQNNHYILNLVHRGSYGGQLLISHQSIVMEEQSGGWITLGNDGSSGGVVCLRYADNFGALLKPMVPGFSHPLIFFPRQMDYRGDLHWYFPAIIGWAGPSTNGQFYNPWQNFGRHDAGELAFYSKVPTPNIEQGLLNDGVEMGRMRVDGWDLRGTLTQQRTTLTSTGTNVAIDVGTNYFVDITLTDNAKFSVFNWHATQGNVQTAVLLVRAGGAVRTVTWPLWKIFNRSAPGTLLSNAVCRVTLQCVGDGDSNVLANFDVTK